MKNVIVTGSSSGFGFLAAQTLASNGFKVWAAMRQSNSKNQERKAELETFAEEHLLQLRVLDLDVTSNTATRLAIQRVIDEDGKIDTLINNAGVMYVGITEAFDIQQLQHQFDVNFYGIVRSVRAVAPFMRNKRRGLIINTTSLAGRLSFPYFGAYCASKFAAEAYSQSLRYELAPFGVEVCIVEPGPFPTNLLYSGPDEADLDIRD